VLGLVVLAILIAVVLVIGPIGWAVLIFGLPIWALGTSWFLFRDATHSNEGAAVAAARPISNM